MLDEQPAGAGAATIVVAAPAAFAIAAARIHCWPLLMSGPVAMSRIFLYDASTRPVMAVPSVVHRVPVELDRGGGVPLYLQVAEQFRAAIRDGSVPIGGRLGNELAIAERCRVSRHTIRRAIAELVDQGLVVRKRGVGTQVVHDHIERPLRLSGLFDDLVQGHLHPHTRVLANEVGPAPDAVAGKLQVAPDESVRRLRRLRFAGGEPLAILENFLPTDRVDIADADLGSGGLYQAMRAAGVRMRVANQRIGARGGTEQECHLLNEPLRSPVVTMERLTHDDTGRPVEWGRHTYRASMYTVTVTLVGR